MSSARSERRMTRWQEQRWLLDAVIRTVGIEWDQARIASKSKPGGETAEADFRGVARRVKKFEDIHREFAAAGRKREAKARACEEAGHTVAAAESYISAALLWASACWPIFEECETLHAYEERMNACYAGFIRHAPHPVERVEIPFEGKQLPCYLHLPRKPAAGRAVPLHHVDRRHGRQQGEYGRDLRRPLPDARPRRARHRWPRPGGERRAAASSCDRK